MNTFISLIGVILGLQVFGLILFFILFDLIRRQNIRAENRISNHMDEIDFRCRQLDKDLSTLKKHFGLSNRRGKPTIKE